MAARGAGATREWTHWDLNPGPSASGADVIPLHHEPVVAFLTKTYYIICAHCAMTSQHNTAGSGQITFPAGRDASEAEKG